MRTAGRSEERPAVHGAESDQLWLAPLPDRTGMLSRMCESGSSPLAWVEFSVHCWFCGAERIGTSWRTVTGTRPTSEARLALAGRPTHGLFREPCTSASWGLMSPCVDWL